MDDDGSFAVFSDVDFLLCDEAGTNLLLFGQNIRKNTLCSLLIAAASGDAFAVFSQRCGFEPIAFISPLDDGLTTSGDNFRTIGYGDRVGFLIQVGHGLLRLPFT